MSEQNNVKRLLISGEVNYKVQDSFFSPVSAVLSEISAETVKFVTTESLSPGTLLQLDIKVTDFSDAIPAVGVVRHQTPCAVKFLLNTEAELREMDAKCRSRLDNFIRNFSANIKLERLNLRCAFLNDVYYQTEDSGEKRRCFSGDIGAQGLKLFIDEHIPVNTVLRLEFKLSGTEPEITAAGTVVWGREMITRMIGIKFTEISESDRRRIIKFVETSLTQS